MKSVIDENALSIERIESTLIPLSDAINIALYASLTDIDMYFVNDDYAYLRRCYSRLRSFSIAFPETYSFQLMRFVVGANLGKFLSGQ
jgi:hypothetical protein